MILVTGASGYVGGMALRCLSAMGHPVTAMARNPRKAEETVPTGVPIRVADYDDVASLKTSFEGVSVSCLLPATAMGEMYCATMRT
jgi:NAD(P)H dehydrogenase (quinone)